jgi:ATP/maltotriose-dependent transcriptional regulator MalT
LDRQISWIAAPAGTGKSHLLQQIADQFSGHVISLQIEEADADPGRFFHRLTRSASKAADVGVCPPSVRKI